ncbi:MAG: bifunctional glutamate N-acetyltransferase/amino-acid acetyltransferase ArgJ [Nisaea sp.]|uniref:bifunctional glutamate N-acetyltransferase/amino-acid acetyltransferase ArgJ n=1 Tax=Nisaea sp. TaxID=2024842 RepID=UPI001B200ED7|nr:bifunctional glutamate N-acetyltransferase/amino-acid acetyltransferase ArgJ [Nisaea sp.]MBO6559391.1 bifunctional glutamate N-acetyltransferase/amino-acid acetyltransferase ArgJ [Nisaea sp.]
MSDQVSPLAPESFPELPAIAGVRTAAVMAGIKYRNRPDVLVAELAEGTTVAGALTRSTTPGAPVAWCREILPKGSGRALVVNSGNANVFTGEAGKAAVRETASAVAALLSCAPDEVFVASTGVIGELLAHDKIVAKLPEAKEALKEGAWDAAATAIRTTDTFAKGAGATTEIGGKAVKIAGIAKGSGMVQPNMATMLSFVFTDAAIPADILQAVLTPAVDRTFNSITVDSDTSTSDTLLLFATGKAGNAAPSSADDPALDAFKAALEGVLKELALLVVRDGEGAQKLIEVRVTGADNDLSARKIALSIANSPLVKTAIAGEDANWGRVVMAVGKSEQPINISKIRIGFGGTDIAVNGKRDPNYNEAPVAAHLKGREIGIDVDVGVGSGKSTVWTCDLTHGYISINADYRS